MYTGETEVLSIQRKVVVLPIKMLAKRGFWWVFYFFGITELFLSPISLNNLFAKILDDPFLMYLY